jgi:hypothetical protein
MALRHYRMERMFFRREKARCYSFAERLEMLKEAAFTVEPRAGDKAVVIRRGCAALIENVAGAPPAILKSGLLIGQEVAQLLDAGYQKLWCTASGLREPVQAAHLTALHTFQEDLRESLGLTSLYNESLGTVSGAHRYDRVAGRE